MKRLLTFLMACLTALAFSGCSSKEAAFPVPDKPGIAFYKPSDRETILLGSLGLGSSSQFLSFRAPAEASSLKADVYRLADGAWQSVGGGAISLDIGRDGDSTLAGLFAMALGPDYTVDFNISTGPDLGSMASYTSDEIQLDAEILSSATSFFQQEGEQPREIELGKEIPVALMMYNSGSSMKDFGLADYFHPEKLADADLAQTVVLTFE